MKIADLEHLEVISKEKSVAGGIVIANATSSTKALGEIYNKVNALTAAYASASTFIKFLPNQSPALSRVYIAASRSSIYASAR